VNVGRRPDRAARGTLAVIIAVNVGQGTSLLRCGTLPSLPRQSALLAQCAVAVPFAQHKALR
jgi:hypothetical protein